MVYTIISLHSQVVTLVLLAPFLSCALEKILDYDENDHGSDNFFINIKIKLYHKKILYTTTEILKCSVLKMVALVQVTFYVDGPLQL